VSGLVANTRDLLMGLLFRPYRPIIRLAAGVTEPVVSQVVPPGVPQGGPPEHAEGRLQPDPDNESAASTSVPEGAHPTRSREWPAWLTTPPTRHRMHRRDRMVSILERLARLHESGELDDTEFEAAKSRLLGP
jgi:hypothetical protein